MAFAIYAARISKLPEGMNSWAPNDLKYEAIASLQAADIFLEHSSKCIDPALKPEQPSRKGPVGG
jgi:hypothetical protein